MNALLRPARLLLPLLCLLFPFTTQAQAPRAPELARLEAGLTAAEGVRAVKRLQYAYAHYLDEGRWSDLADLFTADAMAQFGADQPKGREALRRHFMAQASRRGDGLAAGQLNTHLMMQPIITLGADGRTAKGTWHEMSMLGEFGKQASWRGGVYENEYVVEGGVWKISRLRFVEQYRGAYEDYGHKAPAKWNIPYHFDGKHVGVSVPEAAVAALTPVAGRAAGFDALARRAARLRDETEVQNLQHAFGYYLDRKLWDDVADLFAERGVLDVAQRGAYAGRAHIRSALQEFHGATPLQRGELFDHLLFDTVVSIAADGVSAAARTVQLAQLGQTGEFAQWELGVYENQFVKEQGRWKLLAVRYFPRMTTDYDLGWARDVRPAPAPSSALPPDRKPEGYDGFPKLQSVGIHFVHPVTHRAARAIPGAMVHVEIVKPVKEGRSPKAQAAPTAAQLLSLRNEIVRATGVDAVENLNSSYGYYIDESDWNAMADTYSLKAGAKELTGAGTYVGQERIRTALNLRGPAGGRSANFFTIHQLVQPVIHVAADGLSAKARLRLFQGGGNADGSSGSWIGGIYENTAVFEDGEWKFGIQDLTHTFNASYRNGWGRIGVTAAALPGRAPSDRDSRGGGITQGLGGAASPSSWQSQFPPDRRIRARQYAFPEIVEPAFHYTNPVSGRTPPELLPE